MPTPRRLTYKLIKAGIKLAGEVPQDLDESLQLLAWLSQAGFGKACLPSLKAYIILRQVLKGRGQFTVSRYRRRRGQGGVWTEDKLKKATEQFGIVYPSECTSPRKRGHKEMRGRDGRYIYAKRRKESQTPLKERVAAWKQADGPTVKALVELYNARLSLCRIRSASQGDLSLILPNATSVNYVRLESSNPCFDRFVDDLTRIFHFQTVPLAVVFGEIYRISKG